LRRYLHVTGERATPNSNHMPDGTRALPPQDSYLMLQGDELKLQ
jgi:hypothetical protein